MRRSALLLPVAALAAAAYPTWDDWSTRLGTPDGEPLAYSCVLSFAGFADTSPFGPLRGDLHTLTSWTTTWGVPAVAVLAAFALRGSPRAGRWAAAVLTLIAVAGPVTPVWSGDGPCDPPLRLLSPAWFGTVAEVWGGRELALLAAALLVLLATGQGERPAAPRPATPAWRRAVTLLMDYLVISTVTVLAVRLTGGWGIEVDAGLLHWLTLGEILREPARLLFFPALAGYVLLRRRGGDAASP
ncbi:hypothetical protein MF672_019375 [Actinomadura sp. ATCC 31491]|uniref:DUF998 domain-containing protein n=1 Tax=Actinomadura luzonensis TaxID=2805427 RepID=A0ABT0FVD4_9ACTN|nr:hypothetical protein [Actinomadura luzonensis]MCK2215940.1 hypothetical protein [Actinomadura luzonensis]